MKEAQLQRQKTLETEEKLRETNRMLHKVQVLINH